MSVLVFLTLSSEFAVSYSVSCMRAGLIPIFFGSRIYRMDNNECIIGMERVAMIPLLAFDAGVNIYLTFLFLIPLKSKSTTFSPWFPSYSS